MNSTLGRNLGDSLPNGWKPAKLGDICEITMGTSPRGHTYNRDGIGEPLLNGPTEFGPRHPVAIQWTTDASRFAEPGDILFCVRGATTGRKNVSDRRYCIGRGLAALRGRGELADTDFLWYVLDVATNELVGRAAGSTFVNLPGAELKRFQVPLPPLSEQKRIAGILKEQHAAVELARTAAEAELEAAAALPGAYLREVFQGPIAAKWQRVRFAEIVHEMRYGTSAKSQEQGYATLRIPNVLGGAVDLSDLKRVPLDERELKGLRLIDGDILFVRTNGNPRNIGRSAIFAESDIVRPDVRRSEVIFASYLIRARPNQSIVLPRFVQLYLQSRSGRAELFGHCKTSAGQFNISIGGIGALSIPVPTLDVQKDVVARTNDKFDSAKRMRSMVEGQLAIMTALPAALLRAAFQGKI